MRPAREYARAGRSDVELEVYWAPGSAPAWRVLLTLAVKGVAYASRPLRFARREHRDDAFLAINPRGKVPAIRDGDFTLHESLAIMVYLDRRHPTPPLFGETAEEAGLVFRLVGEHESYFWGPLLALVRPVLYGGPGATAEKAEAIDAAATALRDELARLESVLEASPYLAGAALSAADLVWYPSVQLVMRAAARPAGARLGLTLTPRLAAWCARIEALPVIYPPGFRA